MLGPGCSSSLWEYDVLEGDGVKWTGSFPQGIGNLKVLAETTQREKHVNLQITCCV